MVPAGPRRDSQRQRQKLLHPRKRMRGARPAHHQAANALPHAPLRGADAQHRVRDRQLHAQGARRDGRRRLQRAARALCWRGRMPHLPARRHSGIPAGLVLPHRRSGAHRAHAPEGPRAGRAARRHRAPRVEDVSLLHPRSCARPRTRARPARQQPGRRPRARRCGALREHGPLHVQAALPARLWAVAHGVPPPMPRRGRRASACGEPRERRQRRGARGLPQPQRFGASPSAWRARG